ncbi:phosphoribosylamine-glycine ligase [Cryptococcus neoformans var. grubii Br795]|uniref:Phosphoribosylamine-glycine ligase n=1 Tax=Cryptococcus neoformans Tu259-1 TaxID=1230072 RepID=A0A854Q2F7_CRYNE|nr:phosphoribosylamine-glycine ligase [Cryptococcus neoformans var. grubii 125.91]OXG10694.1 phosphoribosylamine-glycine ligase [Cryptococcus neoformans var. grubii Tu259-1]OXG43407.1 phosphoribosylamine-glycine ligase [Cryptococcus neoformans var. grubii Th84]OXG73079.1 phosphoribosylamine-glycine ligase [Cryptococcus neoformans var. grubii Br795]OXH00788.1 phosphoribosylamine-glycine ligase [Cryptococcus neoformans var. grubii]
MPEITAFPQPKSDLSILLLGAGGREHALAFKLAQSSRVARIVVCPGNGGTALMGGKVSNLALPWGAPPAFRSIVEWAQKENIDLVVPGPEQPLVDGVEGAFKKVGIPVFGPSPAAAMLEGSKSLSKEFMARHNIPTAAFRSFTSTQYEDAVAYIKSKPFTSGRSVIKASGLAAGKGVLIPETDEEAFAALKSVMVDKEFGDAGDEVVVEEYLSGPEISVLAFSDGYTIVPMPAAQDHKRIGEGDTGLNTGGMGAYAPAPIATKEIMERCVKDVLEPTIKGMREDGYPFVGMLFTGFMITADGPRVLEYNVRFGDPETQALMLLLDEQTDLAEVLLACVERRLDSIKLGYKQGYAVSVVLASEGYPGSYPKGLPMTLNPTPEGVEVFHAGTKGSDNVTVTDGGRVLAVCASAPTLRAAVDLAYSGISQISFQGQTFRRDIAYRALSSEPPAEPKGLTYAAAGVSVDAGNDLVEAIKPVVKATRRPGADSDIGGFGGAFDLAKAGYKDPILVSGTDGVGTKLRVALDHGKHNTVGIDLVAMSVNDLIVQGAEPLYFLDYYACSKLDVPVAADVITGIAEGCLQAGCALIGGETAEMPGMYHGDDYDLAGFAVGVVERAQILPTPDIASGDVLLALSSSGPHSNGFSLIRKIVSLSNLSLHDTAPWDKNTSVGDALLTPTKVYIKPLLPGIKSGLYKGMSHITGGGFTENIPRIFSSASNLGVKLDLTSYSLPAIWKWLMRAGNVEAKEMVRTFNCGVGMIIIVAKDKADAALSSLKENGEEAWVIGEVQEKKGVEYVGLDKFGL